MIGTLVAEASILKFIWCLYLVLDDWEQRVTEHLLEVEAINVDETSVPITQSWL